MKLSAKFPLGISIILILIFLSVPVCTSRIMISKDGPSGELVREIPQIPQIARFYYVDNRTVGDLFSDKNGNFEEWITDTDAKYWDEDLLNGAHLKSPDRVEGRFSARTIVSITNEVGLARFLYIQGDALLAPNANNFTIWWKLNSLSAPKGYVFVWLILSTRNKISLDGLIHEEFATDILYILASGREAMFTNTTHKHYIYGSSVPGYNTTGVWNKLSRNLFEDYRSILGVSPTYAYRVHVMIGVRTEVKDTGVIDCLFDSCSFYALQEDVSETKVVEPSYSIEEDVIYWRFELTPTLRKGSNLIFALSLLKVHEILNITCPDGTRLPSFDEILEYNLTHNEGRIFLSTTEKHGFGTYTVYTKSLLVPIPILGMKVYESDKKIESPPFFDPSEMVLVKAYVLDALTGALKPGVTVSLFMIDDVGNRLDAVTGVTDESGVYWAQFTSPNEIGMRFYIDGYATYEGYSIGEAAGPYIVTGLSVSDYSIDIPNRKAYVTLVYAHDGSPVDVGYVKLFDIYRFTNQSGIATFELVYLGEPCLAPTAMPIYGPYGLTYKARTLTLPIAKAGGYIAEVKKGKFREFYFISDTAELICSLEAPSGTLSELIIASSYKPYLVRIEAEELRDPIANKTNFDLVTRNAWYYDNATKTLYVKGVHPSLLTVVIAYAPPLPPSPLWIMLTSPWTYLALALIIAAALFLSWKKRAAPKEAVSLG